MLKVIEGLLWSLTGFVGGFSLCWFMTRSVQTGAEGDSPMSRGSRKSDVIRALFGLLLLVMVVISGIRYYSTTTCQTEYNEAVADALRQRSSAQGDQTRAQIELLEASVTGNLEATKRESLEYIAASKELERVRALSPLPSNPMCGGF